MICQGWPRPNSNKFGFTDSSWINPGIDSPDYIVIYRFIFGNSQLLPLYLLRDNGAQNINQTLAYLNGNINYVIIIKIFVFVSIFISKAKKMKCKRPTINVKRSNERTLPSTYPTWTFRKLKNKKLDDLKLVSFSERNVSRNVSELSSKSRFKTEIMFWKKTFSSIWVLYGFCDVILFVCVHSIFLQRKRKRTDREIHNFF